MSKIAFVGDVHGNIKRMYEEVSAAEKDLNIQIDLIFQAGDFHAIRDEKDLNKFPVPAHYRTLGDFPVYYVRGEAPKKTFFIGGNHENNYWLSEYPEGKEIIRDLFYLGRAGVLEIDTIRLGWVSGNYSPATYEKKKEGKYNHFKSEDLQKVIAQKRHIDILLLHDWPSIKSLEGFIIKGTVSDPKVLEYSIKKELGCQALFNLVREIKPRYVFCGHMHTPLAFEAALDGTQTRFVALNRLGRVNSIAIIDTETMVGRFYPKKEGLFDILDPVERTPVETAFRYLGDDRLNEAIELFKTIISGACSEEAKSFGNYGLGVAYTKQTRNAGFTDFACIENSVVCLKKSVEKIAYADAYLMLGHALLDKILFISAKEVATNEKDRRLISLGDEAIAAFKRAAELNKGWAPQAEKEIVSLEGSKRGLEERIRERDSKR